MNKSQKKKCSALTIILIIVAAYFAFQIYNNIQVGNMTSNLCDMRQELSDMRVEGVEYPNKTDMELKIESLEMMDCLSLAPSFYTEAINEFYFLVIIIILIILSRKFDNFRTS